MARSISILFLLLFISCSRDEIRSIAFTAITDPQANDIKIELAWIFISDEHGNVLDLKPVEDESVIELTAPVDVKTLTVTTLEIFHDGSDQSYSLKSVNGVDRGKTWRFQQDSPKLETTGSAKIEITEYAEDEFAAANIFVSSRGTYIPQSVIAANGKAQVNCTLYYDQQDILLSGFRNDQPVYKFFESVKPNTSITVSFNDFLAAEYVFELPIGWSGGVFGIYNDGSKHVISPAYDISEQLGYPKGFARYFSRLYRPGSGRPSIYYEKYGEPVTSLPPFDLTYQIKSTDFNHLEFTCSHPFTYSTALWTGQKVTWLVTNDAARILPAPALPNELISRYPGINNHVDTFILLNVSVVTDSFSGYNDYMEVYHSNIGDHVTGYEKITYASHN